ncbi:agarase [Paraglaciecola arctica]|uniref:agarase n=1 Tax=Paraglaciecola arctica TaxID=1128911 RepID=UPI001C06B757|nr:agarase [Paraglaciecola arctica]MBU3005375.1 agarase [Paraglaciecola arctica]
MKITPTKHYSIRLGLTVFLFTVFGCSHYQNSDKQQSKEQSTSVDSFANEQPLLTLYDPSDELHKSELIMSGASSEVITASGDPKLSVEFSPQHNISQLRIEALEPWDTSVFKQANLALDVENRSQESIHVYLALENQQGQSRRYSVSLPKAYKGTVYLPLSGVEADTDAGLWGDVPPWNTQDRMFVWRSWRSADVKLDKIKALDFFTIGILEPKSLTIDNVRIRQNPATDPNWLVGIVDQYGQNARLDTAMTIHTDEELKLQAQQELAELAQSKGMPHRSRFGGYTNAPKLNATGYFRTEKVNGKWWMVDPDGYLFFSHGPANVRMANMSTITGVDYADPSVRVIHADELTPEDSMGIVEVSDAAKATRFVTSPVRNNMFEWLPGYDDPLADHYSYRRSTHKGPVAHGETYSFYRANLERRYGETTPQSYLKKWHEVTMQRMFDWGFTSFGNWVDPAFYPAKKVPYFANGWIIGDYQTLSGETNHWGLMPDPFDPVFAERAKSTINAIAENVKASPWCVGIFIDNEKSWGEREGSVIARYGVIVDALSKDSQHSPAKAAFSTHIKQQYPNIEQLNSAWSTDLKSWQEFEKGIKVSDYTQQHIQDLSAMLAMLGEQYFLVVHDTLAKALPNHLYMGARMANWGMPDEIITASLKYSDVLSFNIYEEGMQDHYWKFLEETDLPVVVGEFHIGTATDSGMFNPGIVHAANQTDRARMYKNYMQSILDKPYMVGAHWFQYVDEPISGRAFDGENANIGFVTTTDIPYPELIQAVKDFTSTMYQQRYEQ